MTNKIKSLLYLSCFAFASIVYNATIEENMPKLSEKMEMTKTNTLVDSHSEDLQLATMN